MAAKGLFLVNAYNVLLYMTATNEQGGYFEGQESESSSCRFTLELNQKEINLITSRSLVNITKIQKQGNDNEMMGNERKD
jgi:hypothetical protein